MREFIDNPFETEFEDDEDLDDFIDGLRIAQAAQLLMDAPDDVDVEEEGEDNYRNVAPGDIEIDADDHDDDDDPDYILDDARLGSPKNMEEVEEGHDVDLDNDPDCIVCHHQTNDGYDTDGSQALEDMTNYEFRESISGDELDEELDYVTFPFTENHSPASDTTSKTTNQDSSNASNSDQELTTEEEWWD